MRGQPGVVDTCRPSDAPRRNCASARPFALCCAIRSGSVLVPRSTSHESNGLRIAPAAFCTNFSHSMSSSARRDDHAADAVAVAVQIFGRAVRDEVGAELDRPLQARAGERVVDDEPRVVRCARSAAARRSVSRITGLLGVSTNSIRVAGVNGPLDGRRDRRCRRSVNVSWYRVSTLSNSRNVPP